MLVCKLQDAPHQLDKLAQHILLTRIFLYLALCPPKLGLVSNLYCKSVDVCRHFQAKFWEIAKQNQRIFLLGRKWEFIASSSRVRLEMGVAYITRNSGCKADLQPKRKDQPGYLPPIGLRSRGYTYTHIAVCMCVCTLYIYIYIYIYIYTFVCVTKLFLHSFMSAKIVSLAKYRYLMPVLSQVIVFWFNHCWL